MNKLKHIKEKAIQLRQDGNSLDKISEMLNTSRTTVYYWIKDIKAKINKQPPNAKLASEAMQKKYKLLRESAYAEGIEIYKLRKDDKLFRDFIVIYLTEGTRKTKHSPNISNSNSSILKLSKYIAEQFTTKQIDVTVQYYEDHNTDKLRQYWAEQLNVLPESIRMLPKSNAGKLSGRKWNSPYGVTNIRWHDTYLRCKIQAWMDKLQEEWD